MDLSAKYDALVSGVIDASMDPHRAQEIRQAYYDVVCGLRTLADELEIADSTQTPTGGVLITEHMFAIEVLDAMKHSRLGVIL